jgi:hypothetical protein
MLDSRSLAFFGVLGVPGDFTLTTPAAGDSLLCGETNRYERYGARQSGAGQPSLT